MDIRWWVQYWLGFLGTLAIYHLVRLTVVSIRQHWKERKARIDCWKQSEPYGFRKDGSHWSE